MKEVRHIFWDWNGTLLDDAWLCRDVMNGMLRARGMEPLTPERYREIFDFPVSRYYERIGFDLESETFEVLGHEFISGYEARRHEARLYADAIEALTATEKGGRGQSILSAYHHDTLVTLVRDHGLDDFFHDLHGHEDIYAVGKTPQGRRALEALGIAPQETVLIGDTVHDAEVAEELGMHCILVPGGNQPEEKLRAVGVPVYDSRMAALAAIG